MEDFNFNKGQRTNFIFKKSAILAALVTLNIAVLSLVLGGCKTTGHGSKASSIEDIPEVTNTWTCGDAKTITIEGMLIRKEWSKSYESLRAGGSEYYMIGMSILRPSEQVPFEEFEKFKNKKVIVRGFHVKGKPYTPGPEYQGQWMVDTDGKYVTIMEGAGFKVCEIMEAK